MVYVARYMAHCVRSSLCCTMGGVRNNKMYSVRCMVHVVLSVMHNNVWCAVLHGAWSKNVRYLCGHCGVYDFGA